MVLLILTVDLSIYFYSYNEVINFQETVCNLVANQGGITSSIKELVYSKNMFLEYEKSSDINGATFEFTLCKEINYLFSTNEKYIKLDLVVILGY